MADRLRALVPSTGFGDNRPDLRQGGMAMRRVGPHSFTEVYFAGCNPSFVETSDGYVMIDSPQQPIDAVRWRERMEDKAPIRYLINTEPHGDHISGNAYFTGGTQIVGQVKLPECFERYLWAFGSLDEKRERFKETDPDSVWLVGHPDYPPVNAPTLTFDDRLTLNVGNHSFHIIHMPGHTAPQTSVLVPEEGVVFTGDNVFHKCRSWLQECDPWEWLAALKSIEALDVETIVPGHGEPCGKAYLKEQAQIVENWVGFVERFVERGVGPDEILKGPVEVTRQDPYPIGQRLFALNDRLTEMIVRNLHQRILDKKQQPATACALGGNRTGRVRRDAAADLVGLALRGGRRLQPCRGRRRMGLCRRHHRL